MRNKLDLDFLNVKGKLLNVARKRETANMRESKGTDSRTCEVLSEKMEGDARNNSIKILEELSGG